MPPSATARLIARCEVLAAQEPALAELVPRTHGARAACALAAAGARTWAEPCARGSIRRLLWRGERAVLPGFVAHVARRKHQLSLWTDEAIALGARRLVVLGAGCDGLASRIARRHRGVECIAIDAASSALRDGDGVAHIRADLSRSELAVLETNRPTVVVAEGLLMYLDPEAVARLLELLACRLPPGSELLLTAMSGPRFGGASRIVERWLRAVGEPFRWHLPPEALGGFLAGRGWSLRELAGREELRALGGGRFPEASGEYLARAVRA
jgi:O-methyltransferase involved in polyketide biosynthesis